MLFRSNGNLNQVKELLNQGVPVNSRNEDGWTPLHHAAQNGRLNVVQELLKRGAHVHSRDQTGRTPLLTAAYWEHPRVVHELLKAGANPRYANIYGYHVLKFRHTKPTRNAVKTSRAATKWQSMTRKRRAARMLLSPRLLGSTKLNSKSISNIARYLTVKKV